MVLPVEVAGDADPDTHVRCRLDDGRDLPCTLHWISVEQTEDASGYRWLPDPLAWRSHPPDSPRPASVAGFWVVAIDVPQDAVGQGIWIERSRVDVTWVADPALALLNGRPMAWPSPVSDQARASPYFGRLIDPVRHNPLTRWRYKLIVDGLEPDPLGTRREADEIRPVQFDDPVLEAFAERAEDLWRAAIARVRQDDPRLAATFVRRLVDVIDFGDGVVAPAWPTDQLVLDTLQDALLSPRTTSEARIQAVQQWLDELPAGVTWVIDDAGQIDALSGDALVSIGVANLGRANVMTSVFDGRQPTRRDALLVAAGTADTLSVPVAPPDRGQATARVDVEMGSWTSARPVLSGAIEAAPPGVRIEPLLGDWSMAGWFAGVPTSNVRGDGRLGTAAQFVRLDDGMSTPRWAIYGECLRLLDDRFDTPLPGTDWVRVWIGPTGQPDAVYRIWRDGRIVNEASDAQSGALADAKVVDEGDRWSFLVPLDADLFGPDGVIRLGLERIDARGRRFSWPEPMLPWQIEPARAAIDTRAWTGAPSALR